jgi:hypothetical protein
MLLTVSFVKGDLGNGCRSEISGAWLDGQSLLGPLEELPLRPMLPLPFSSKTPQRNRNELGETTVNKTRQKRLSPQEKSTT